MPRSLAVSTSAFAAAMRAGLKSVDAVMASPPTVGALATATAIASAKAWPSVVGNSGGNAVSYSHFSYRCGGLVLHGTSFPDYTYVRSTAITDGNVPANPGPILLDFLFDGTQLEIQFKGMAGTLRLRVDGELVSATPYTTTATGSTYFLPITFATRAVRRISVEMAGHVFGGVTTGPNDTVLKYAAMPTCIVVGDSFTEGSGAASGAMGWVRRMGECLGLPDTRASGLGGTGYLAVNSSRVKFRDRIVTDCINFAPDMYVIAGGINDHTAFTAAAISAEASTLFAQLRSALPNARGYVLSPFWRNGVETFPATLLPVRDAIKAAAIANGLTFVDLLEMPLGGTANATTLASAASASATTISLVGCVPVGATIEIGAGATVERRVVTAISGVGPWSATVAALTSGHSSGEAVRTVGSCLWTGAGKVGATTGSGNSDLLVSSDGTHPTQAGHDLIGVTVARLIANP